MKIETLHLDAASTHHRLDQSQPFERHMPEGENSHTVDYGKQTRSGAFTHFRSVKTPGDCS
jgi:hypothetical protein